MARREAISEHASILLKKTFMLWQMVENLSLGSWRVLSSCVRVRQRSKSLSPEREPHQLRLRSPLKRARPKSQTLMTSSRYFDIVLGRRMIQIEQREW